MMGNRGSGISAALEKIDRVKRLRDPIYGFIMLSKAEEQIIDTPLFQRLRRIHQLALEKYVYPGAEHTRFGHSLGVLHSSTRLCESIFRDADMCDMTEEVLCNNLKTLRFAALLHDIGHLPFSHSTEEIFLPKGIRHEQISAYIVENYEKIRKIIEDEGVSPTDVGYLIAPKLEKDLPLTGELPPIFKMIISGHLDADRADYLLRDSYYCGVKYGVYDFDRYVGAMKADEISSPQTWLYSDDVPVMEEFLMARYQYNLQVPYHRTRVMYDIMLGELLKQTKKHDNNFSFVGKVNDIIRTAGSKISSIDFEGFAKLNDYSFFTCLDELSIGDDYWAQALRRGPHLTLAFEGFGEKEDCERDYREKIDRLSSEKFKENIDFFPWSAPIRLHKMEEEDRQIEVRDKRNNKPLGDIDKFSILFKSFGRKNVFLWRIYARQGGVLDSVNDMNRER
jgi:HD superfamily phosphohydrolase